MFNIAYLLAKMQCLYIGGPKMSGNFVHCKRERQRIVYIYNIHKGPVVSVKAFSLNGG